jgi:hypothetical protein
MEYETSNTIIRHGVQLKEIKLSDLDRDNLGFFIGINGKRARKGQTFITTTIKKKIYAGFGILR